MIIPKQNDLFFLQTFNMHCLSQFICYVITYTVLFLLLFLVCVCAILQCIINYLERRNSSYVFNNKNRFHLVFSIVVHIYKALYI